MNPTLVSTTGTALQMLGFALLIGGMLALGAFTAPVLFKQFPRIEAGEAMTLIFRRYDVVLMVCLGLVALGEVLRFWGLGFTGFGLSGIHLISTIRYALLGLLTALMVISLFQINPSIEEMQKSGALYDTASNHKAFHEAHQLSEKLYKTQLLLAVLIVLLTPYLDHRQLP